MILRAASLATPLVIGGMEQNPDLGMEDEKFMQVLCGGCGRILKSGTRLKGVFGGAVP